MSCWQYFAPRSPNSRRIWSSLRLHGFTARPPSMRTRLMYQRLPTLYAGRSPRSHIRRMHASLLPVMNGQLSRRHLRRSTVWQRVTRLACFGHGIAPRNTRTRRGGSQAQGGLGRLRLIHRIRPLPGFRARFGIRLAPLGIRKNRPAHAPHESRQLRLPDGDSQCVLLLPARPIDRRIALRFASAASWFPTTAAMKARPTNSISLLLPLRHLAAFCAPDGCGPLTAAARVLTKTGRPVVARVTARSQAGYAPFPSTLMTCFRRPLPLSPIWRT